MPYIVVPFARFIIAMPGTIHIDIILAINVFFNVIIMYKSQTTYMHWSHISKESGVIFNGIVYHFRKTGTPLKIL